MHFKMIGEPANKSLASAAEYGHELNHAIRHIDTLVAMEVMGGGPNTIAIFPCLNGGKQIEAVQATVDFLQRAAEAAKDMHAFLTEACEHAQAFTKRTPTVTPMPFKKGG